MSYIKSIIVGIWRLMQGMYITMLNFIRPKVTECYPENRGKTEPLGAMRGELVMFHNGNNQHQCTACGICQMNCPNDTIQIITKMVPTGEEGKEKKALDKYMYDLGSCTFCSICTISCPQNAIEWSKNFEHATFTSPKLVNQLNRVGSTLMEKEKV
ncbi:NADH dehydrogenase I subunit I [Candidatus Symbiothrix dinenymphae]|nr:NADH dehydrogenase I subunit I [Candidatus Symbiothrix dinenymphae]